MRNLAVLSVLAAVAGTAMGAVHSYPGANGSATVVGSIGYLNPNEVGYFWSMTRGDSVTQAFADGLPTVNQTRLDLGVPTNVLSGGNSVTWDVRLNGSWIGSFTVLQGFTGPVTHTFNHAAIAHVGGMYTVRMEVTNEVPGGGGSHTFLAGAPAGAIGSTVTLVPAPASLALLGLGGLVAGRRRR